MFYKTLVMQSQLDNPISPLDTCASGLVWSVASLDRTPSKKKKPGYGPAWVASGARDPDIANDTGFLAAFMIDTTRRSGCRGQKTLYGIIFRQSTPDWQKEKMTSPRLDKESEILS